MDGPNKKIEVFEKAFFEDESELSFRISKARTLESKLHGHFEFQNQFTLDLTPKKLDNRTAVRVARVTLTVFGIELNDDINSYS